LTAFNIAKNTPEPFYKWLETHPVQGGAFQRFMEVQFSMLPTWLSIINFAQEYGQATRPETPIFVDVGGGSGHQCAELRSKFPGVKGRVILQDRPAVLANAISRPDVERMEHDYLTEQTVKGKLLLRRMFSKGKLERK
jgi:demethylsterigmatocystin 6-O-methyltransferase